MFLDDKLVFLSLKFKLSETRGAALSVGFCVDIHGAQSMDPTGFGDPVTFPLL